MRPLVFAHNLLAGMTSLKDQAHDWVADKTFGWPGQPPVNKIDTHHHMVPSFYAKGPPQPPLHNPKELMS